jgi:hypothetical protein
VLSSNDIVNCINEGCKESYRVERRGQQFRFERRKIVITCPGCNLAHEMPYKELAEIEKDLQLTLHCTCGEPVRFIWRLMQVPKSG